MNRVQMLLDFHGTRSFGTRPNLLARQAEARSVYEELTGIECSELAESAIAKADDKKANTVDILCCLACFRPGSLSLFHERLVESRFLYPGVIYHGANESVASRLMSLLEEDECRNHALLALAWIGDSVVVSAFANWRQQPPSWAGSLNVPPDQYSHEAGWELTKNGERRNLFSETTTPLVPKASEDADDGEVRTVVPSEQTCPWCNRRLTILLAFEHIDKSISGIGTQRVLVMTCDACTCFGYVFSKNANGDVLWHTANTRPKYLPPDVTNWPAIPTEPLIPSKQSRQFLAAANWCYIPGVAFSQIGGLPTWINDSEYPSCPECSMTMPFVGQLSNEDYDGYAEGIYYCFHCTNCGVSATNYQQS